LMTDIWNQGVHALQNLPGQKSVEDVFKLQQDYWDVMQGGFQELLESSQNVLQETNRKITAVLQKSTDTAGNTAAKAVKTPAPVKAAADAAKKAAPSAPKKAAAKPAAKTKSPAKALPASPAKSTTTNGSKPADAHKPAAKTETVKADAVKSEVKPDGKTEPAKQAADGAGKKSDLFV
jgi:membrane protein involved in colicin uptake